MPPKRKKDTNGEGDAGEYETKHSTVVMSVHTALEKAARRFTEGSFTPWQAVHDRLFAEVLRQVDANARLGVLASWFMAFYLAWLTDNQLYADLPEEGRITQNTCTTAVNLVNNTGHAAVGRSQPLMVECFAVFEALFPLGYLPAGFLWPRHQRGGNLASALGREMATNYEVYMDLGLTAHAILARLHPVLLHRFLLGAVERRQAAAMDANEMRTPSVLSSLVGVHPPLRRGKNALSRSSSAMPRRSTLALTAGLSVSHSLRIFTSIVAKWTLTVRCGNNGKVLPVRRARCSSSSFTYERRVLKRVVGSDTMAERRKKRKYNKKKGKGKEQAVEPATAAASSLVLVIVQCRFCLCHRSPRPWRQRPRRRRRRSATPSRSLWRTPHRFIDFSLCGLTGSFCRLPRPISPTN